MPFAPPTNYYVRGTMLLYLKSNDELKAINFNSGWPNSSLLIHNKGK